MAANQSAYQAIQQMGLFSGSSRRLPKGTADVTMERLFPEKRSTVPIDDERREEVFSILVMCGALTEQGDVALIDPLEVVDV